MPPLPVRPTIERLAMARMRAIRVHLNTPVSSAITPLFLNIVQVSASHSVPHPICLFQRFDDFLKPSLGKSWWHRISNLFHCDDNTAGGKHMMRRERLQTCQFSEVVFPLAGRMVVELPTSGRDTFSKRPIRVRGEQIRPLRLRYHILMRSGHGDVVDCVSDLNIRFQSQTGLPMGWRRELRQLLARTIA